MTKTRESMPHEADYPTKTTVSVIADHGNGRRGPRNRRFSRKSKDPHLAHVIDDRASVIETHVSMTRAADCMARTRVLVTAGHVHVIRGHESIVFP
ncbi:MAG TPA: hypothetical protein VF432_13935 [Thermoanaerobaculia bacterium]